MSVKPTVLVPVGRSRPLAKVFVKPSVVGSNPTFGATHLSTKSAAGTRRRARLPAETSGARQLDTLREVQAPWPSPGRDARQPQRPAVQVLRRIGDMAVER